MAPYEMYEILVPVDSLLELQQYKIIASWNGGQSQEVVIKRKQRTSFDRDDELYGQSDFKKRKEVSFAKKSLKDQRISSQFEVTVQGTYVNDPEEQIYEIYGDKGSERRFLVFLLSIFKISMAYDEELMMREVDIGLSITPEQGKHSLFTNS